MFLMNKLMKKEYLNIEDNIELNDELIEIIKEGFSINNNCFQLNKLVNSLGSNIDYPSSTEYEYALNEVYVNDYKKSEFLSVGMKFTNVILKDWLIKGDERNLISLISLDLDEYPNLTIRFFIERENEELISKDLDSFEIDTLMLIDSNELKSSKL